MKKLPLVYLMIFAIGSNALSSALKSNVTEKATFAGGCFWCMQHPFEIVHGVSSVVVGYIGGHGENPTYKNYVQKGYVEAVDITFDPAIVAFDGLLDVFWHQIDPTDAEGQFVDRGRQYRSAIFYHTDQQKDVAEKSKNRLQDSGRFSKPIVTEILKASPFYRAEEYHQDYYKKNPLKYTWFRYNSGRDRFITKAWAQKKLPGNFMSFKKPSDQELRTTLTPIQYKVTQRGGTEKPFDNAYWNNEKAGIYVDIVSGEALFGSLDKFDSGTGWPSFTKPLAPENIVEKEDRGWFSTRTEIRSKQGDSHLGHVFNDGPQPTGLRYCMNSAALLFIPVEELEQKGFGKYRKLFSDVRFVE